MTQSECEICAVKRLQVIFCNELSELIVSKKNSHLCLEIVLPTFSSKHCIIQIGALHNGACKDVCISKLIWRGVTPEINLAQ